MFLQAPDDSPYDLRFMLFGFPIRIAWTFWLGAVVIGHSFAMWFDFAAGEMSPGIFPLLFLWTGCLFLSILIHELGHAFAFRYYGQESSIVLYHFGGLAIPSSVRSDGRGFVDTLSPRRSTETSDLVIALAGPIAQIASAFLLAGIVTALGYEVVAFSEMPWPLSEMSRWFTGQPVANVGLMATIFFYVFPSVLWALLNLLPVFPLDGGRVMRSLVLMSGDRGDTWLWISMVSAGAVAFYALTRTQQPIMGLLFLSLGFGNYQMLQSPYR
ncbi:site-2 protease family protein [Aporhodopirellula aestuarii]|uniref:Site-2 protease family protein n=1 Tax=Aporhodopirellula aestuarii TaxID=2950107 RepID=A0ABT0U4A0_9BACT|nr:site-2 protease family protein [Aporhodopirellula aestuarii]MCM2371744.1 site-2 protease family protein [Aporhodopirellula aestuarii]